MKKIVLINCYFGEFPWYFILFLKSCSHNESVDFIIFSDCDNNYQLPINVKIIPFTLEAFNQLSSRKLGFDVIVKSAYKLCDFKPAYGVIFSEYTDGYDFWGMTDIDIVLGRIREFMTNDILETYDVISVRNDYPTGSFMLYKNTETINNLFKKSKDHKKVFQSDTHYCFDECNFKHYFLQEGGNIDHLVCEIESMYHVIIKEIQCNGLRAHFDFLIIEGLPGQLKWDKGILSFKNEFEVLLHHLILYKSNAITVKKEWRKVPETFFIDKYTIRKHSLSSVKGFLVHLYFNKIRSKFFKIIFKADSVLSNRIRISVKGLESGTYKLNDMLFYVIKKDSDENLISYSGEDLGIQLVKSIFYNESFYVENFYFTRFKLKNKENQILTLSINGNVNIYNKMS